MRSREYLEAEPSQTPKRDYASLDTMVEPAPRPWLTIIAAMLFLTAVAAGFYYVNTSKVRNEQAAADNQSNENPDSTPVSETPAVEAVATSLPEEVVTSETAEKVSITPHPDTALRPEEVPVPKTTSATPEVSEKAKDWLSNLTRTTGQNPATATARVPASTSPPPGREGSQAVPASASARAGARKPAPQNSINIGEEVFGESSVDAQASDIIGKLQANNPTPVVPEPETPEQTPATEAITAVTSDNFSDEVLTLSDVPVLVLYWSPQSDQSKAMVPVIVDMARQYSGKIKFVQVVAEANRELLRRNKIEGVPTLTLFKRRREVERHQGAQNPMALKAILDAHIKR